MKMLFINGDIQKFNKYKKLISLIFLFIEQIEGYQDSRYNQLLLTLVNRNLGLPSNVFFLTWNYDQQLEFAAHNINLHFRNQTITSENTLSINGKASKNYAFLRDPSEETSNQKKILIIEEILNTESKIKFAWEVEKNKFDNSNQSVILDEFLLKLRNDNENILISIGYSFPFVNHPYDLQIIKALNPEKIYLQDPKLDLSFSLRERYKLFNTNFEYISDCSRFHIPNELFE